MERWGVKGMMFLLLCPILVEAQGKPLGEACFWGQPFSCGGVMSCCTSLHSQECCELGANPNMIYGWSADVIPPGWPPSGDIFIYTDNYCEDQAYSGQNYYCLAGGCNSNYASSGWRDFRSSGVVPNKPRNKRKYTDTLKYRYITEEGRRATWVLPKVNISEVDFDPRKLSADQQIDWFKSHGATLEVDDGGIISANVTDVPDDVPPECNPSPWPPLL